MTRRLLHAAGRRTLAALILLGASACGATSSPPPPAPAAAPAPVTPTSNDALAREPIGIFRSKRFDLALPLPAGKGFAIDDRSTPWLVARHEASRSTLLVRRWRELEVMTREGCEQAARNGRALPTLDAAEILEVRSLHVPPDHDTEATVALFRPAPRPPATTAPLYGMVLAFGAWSRQCFAYAFVTEHDGIGAEAIVAERLVRMVDQSLAEIRARSDLDPALERETRPGP